MGSQTDDRQEDGTRNHGGTARPVREFTESGRSWRATMAWRASDGSALCYFLDPAGDPAGGEAEDRRVRLEPGRDLTDATREELAQLLEASVPLTDTERRHRAPDGRWWLVQNVGPVWAESDAAEGATGVLFTALEGPRGRGAAAGGHVARLDAGSLDALWRRAVGAPEGDDGTPPPEPAEGGGRQT